MVHRGILVRIEDFARRRWGLVFLIFGLLVAGSLALGSRLRLESDILSLLPKDDPEISAFVDSLNDFGTLDYLLVMLEAPQGQQMEDYDEIVEAFASRLSDLPEVDYVEYRLDENSPVFRLLARHAPLFLDGQGLDRLQAALTDESLRERAKRLREQLESPSSIFLKEWVKRDPLGIAPIFLESAIKSQGALKVDLSTGYYLSADGQALLLIVRPTHPPQDVAFSEKLKTGVEAAFERAKTDVAEEKGDEPAAGLVMKLGGGYIIAIEDSNLIKGDLKFNAWVSFLAVTGLYLFCYRRIAAIFYSVVPLLVGQALTFAVAVLYLGGLNNATAGFTAMLMGLGTDFTIVMYARYVEERRAGASLATATHRMMGETAIGVFTGAITSAGTFGAVCVSRFPGLWDFGFLVGGGILLCLVAILFLLPAMISWNEGRRERRKDVVEKLYLHSFGFEKSLLFVDRHPVAVLTGCIIVTIAAGVSAIGIELSDSYKDLRSPNNQGFLVQEEIGQRFGGSFNYMVAVSRGATASEAVDRSRGVARRLQPWIDSGDLSGYESLSSYLPDEAAQRRVIDRLREGSDGPFSIERIRRTFRAALDAEGFSEGAFDDYLDGLGEELHPSEPLTLADFDTPELSKLVSRYLKKTGDHEYRAATFIFQPDRRWGKGPPAEFIAQVEDGDPMIKLTGVNVVGVRIKDMFRVDAIRALLLGTLLVVVLLMLDFRSIRLTIYGILQLFIGVIWMLGLMRVFGIQMNFVNAFATTMILGVGIDYGIHLIHRIWEDRNLTSFGVQETAKAVVMAALTNIAGFGTVGLSNYPAVRSMGLVCLFGTTCCLITALTLLPALMKLFPEPKAAPPPTD